MRRSRLVGLVLVMTLGALPMISQPSAGTPSDGPSDAGVGELLGIATIDAHDIWVVGDTASKPVRSLALHWDGRSWKRIATLNPGRLAEFADVSAIDTHDVWAVGSYVMRNGGGSLIEHWDGKRWSLVPNPISSSAFSVTLNAVTAIASDDVWAVGFTETYNLTFDPLIEHWNGSAWRVVEGWDDPGTGGLLEDVSARGPDDVWAVGTTSAFPSETVAEHWDGTSWTREPTPNPGGANQFHDLRGVHALAHKNVWAVGSYTTHGSNGKTLSLHWNGSRWARVSAPSPPGSSDGLEAVDGSSEDDIWAVGSTGDDAVAEHWDGSRWQRTAIPQPALVFLLDVAAIRGDDAWAVGADFSERSTQLVIEHWNGTRWRRDQPPSPPSLDRGSPRWLRN